MNNQTINSCVATGAKLAASSHRGEGFASAEQMWFWFLYSRSVRTNRQCNMAAQRANGRVCELLDVETLITKLYLAGQLSAEQLAVMKTFGDKRRAPHQHIWSENRAAALWRTAMATIESAAVKRGWVE
jgi:hypothetical protein